MNKLILILIACAACYGLGYHDHKPIEPKTVWLEYQTPVCNMPIKHNAAYRKTIDTLAAAIPLSALSP